MIADLTKEEKTENLEDKRRLLELLRKRMDFADIQKAYDNWRFSDLVGIMILSECMRIKQ
ncbi:hypothetical protein MWH06_05930 [Wolbachia pipientis]|nr:hypothetical protein MWH06_05930 [Wolbachia pipientis]